jgi:hypothetical protein
MYLAASSAAWAATEVPITTVSARTSPCGGFISQGLVLKCQSALSPLNGSLQSWHARAPSAVEPVIIAPFHLNLAHLCDCVSEVDLQRLDGCFLGHVSCNLIVGLLSKKRIWQGVDFLPQQFDLMAQHMVEIDLIASVEKKVSKNSHLACLSILPGIDRNLRGTYHEHL